MGGSIPSGLVEVGYEIDLARAAARLFQQGVCRLKCLGVVGRAKSGLGLIDQRLQFGFVFRGLSQDFAVRREQRQRQAVDGRRRVSDILGRLTCPLKDTGVAHAVGHIQEDYGSPGDRGQFVVAGSDVRPREGEREQEEGQASERQQQKVAKLAATDGFLLDLADEHQRREGYAWSAGPPDKVHCYRYRGRQDTEQEKRIDESHVSGSGFNLDYLSMKN